MSLLPFHATALRDYRLFESTDLDETRERISQVMQPHALIPSHEGDRRAHMDFVTLGGLGLGTIAFGNAMQVDVDAVDGYYLMMFCLSGHAQVRTADQLIDVDQYCGVLRAPGERFDATLSPDCEQFVLRINAKRLARSIGNSLSSVSARVPLDTEPNRALLQHLQLIAASPELLIRARQNPRIADHLAGLTVELLSDGLMPKLPPRGLRLGVAGEGTSHGTPTFVKRAMEFIEAHSTEALRLMDIADAAEVSARKLSDGFQQNKGVSPMRYLRDSRLDRARARLQDPHSPARVADVAMDCGFLHLSRFAAAYYERFGEMPSETPFR